MEVFCLLAFVLLFGESWVSSPWAEGSKLCPIGNDCSCSRVSDGAFEVSCFRNASTEVSKEEMYMTSPDQVMILFTKVKPGKYAQLQCSLMTEWKDLRLISGLQIENCPTVNFRYCPLPDNSSSMNITSFKALFESIAVQNVTNFQFQSYRNLSDSLKTEHLEDLNGVTKLTLANNGLTFLPEDLFSGVPDLKWVDLQYNKIHVPSSLFHGLPFLESIEMGNNGLRSLPTDVFHKLNNLTHLNLFNNKLGESNLTRSHFKGMISLESLDLNSNALTTLNQDVFYELMSLRTLNLNGNNFISLPGSLFIKNIKLENLRLNDNRVPLLTLPDGLLSNLTFLKNLSLDRCGIESLPNNLLKGSVNLSNLSFQNNKLKDIPGDLLFGAKNLERVNFNGNQLLTLSELTFKGLNTLKLLLLRYNNLSSIHPSLLHDLASLEELDLRNNNLKAFAPATFFRNGRLRKVYLSNNQLSFADSAVDLFGQSSPLQPCTNLEVIDLAYNSLEVLFTDWRLSMLNLRLLNLSHNAISQLSVNDMHFLSDKLIVDLQNNKISAIDLRNADILAINQPESSSERSVEVLLDNNPLICDCNIYHLLRYLEGRTAPQVKRLVDLKVKDLSCLYPYELAGQLITSLNSYTLTCDLELDELTLEEDEAVYRESLAGNNGTQMLGYYNEKCPAFCQCLVRPEDHVLIVDCREGNLSRFPHTLPVIRGTSHTELLANGLGITKLWSAFSLPLGYNRVKVLRLGRNSLSTISASCLPPHLNTLELHQNNLTYLDKDVIAAISNTSEVSLYGNPWRCDCDARDLLEFIQEKFKQVKLLPYMTCKSGYVTDKPLSQLTAYDLCPLPTVVIVAACISVAIFGLFVGTLAALYYRHQHAIKIWLYAHHICLWFVTENELDKDKEYDAFISYSHQDEDFVVGELVPILEGGRFPDNSVDFKKGAMKYKLCLHYRDWIAGEWIPAQIARSVDASRRTIVVLSPAFLESVWGQMEFRAAHCMALSEGRSRVIVILYGDVPPAESLDPELRTYLTTNTYVKWGDPWFWHKLRYALPHFSTKTDKAAPSLAITSDLNRKNLENGNGQCKALELIHTNPTVEVTTKNQ